MISQENENTELNKEQVVTNEPEATTEDNSTETSNNQTVEGISDVTEELQNKLIEAKNQIDNIQDKYLRLCAEFENYRKRTMKEKTEIIKTAAEKTIIAILPVLDDMERAIANMQKSDDAKALLEGVELINSKFLKILSNEGLHKIETENSDFNTDFHEAIAMLPASNEEQKGKIVDCVQTGYQLNDKVIRHAKVAVAQ